MLADRGKKRGKTPHYAPIALSLKMRGKTPDSFEGDGFYINEERDAD
jgi:hypothetical protein